MFFDLHSHMLPGLDDGASSWEQSLAMARLAVKDGIEGVVCTPHWVFGQYNNARAQVLSALENLQRKLAENEIPLKVYPGAELRLDVSLLEGILAGDLLTLNDTGRYALIEIPEGPLPEGLEAFLWDLLREKVVPVISHPERNGALRRNPERLYAWVRMGVLTQITAASLMGKFGTAVSKFAILLLDHNLVHILASDAHGLRIRMPSLSGGYKMLERRAGKDVARRMVYEIPRRIVKGEPVTPKEPIPISSNASGSIRWKRLFPFLVKTAVLILCLSACTLYSHQIMDKREKEESAAWSAQTSSQSEGKRKAESNHTPEFVETPSDAPVQKIAVKEAGRYAEERLIQLRRLSLSPQAYMREKFKGKRVIFPEELQRMAPERPVFKIGPEDVLHIFVWQNPDLSLDVTVWEDGRISLPLVGEIAVAGHEISELESFLEKEYARYIEDPQVTITVKEVNSLKVFITGAVNVSSRITTRLFSGFPLPRDRRLLSALSQVTFPREVDLRETYIVRGDIIIPVDLKRLLEDGDMTQNVILEPADTIVVPSPTKQVSILGEVNLPGRYKVDRRTTVLDAIAVAGGIKDQTVVLHLAYLARKGHILPVNFKRLIDLGDLDQNILVEDNDVIYFPGTRDNRVFVLGEVGRPGVVRFTDPMDVVEAISQANGFKETANRKQVVVVRGGIHEPDFYAINVLDMMKGRTHERFMMNRYDIVYVPRTWLANWHLVTRQLLPGFTEAALWYNILSD